MCVQNQDLVYCNSSFAHAFPVLGEQKKKADENDLQGPVVYPVAALYRYKRQPVRVLWSLRDRLASGDILDRRRAGEQGVFLAIASVAWMTVSSFQQRSLVGGDFCQFRTGENQNPNPTQSPLVITKLGSYLFVVVVKSPRAP